MDLEREFEEFKALHKYAIVRAMVVDYYRTIQAQQVNIPDFMRNDTPEKLADMEIRKLVISDINRFNKLYETAYQELAPLLD